MADQVIVVNAEAQARQQMIEDMKRLKANPLDRSIPGGYFLDYPGAETAHDANGNPVPFRSEGAIKKEVAAAAASEQVETPAAPVTEKPARSRSKKAK